MDNIRTTPAQFTKAKRDTVCCICFDDLNIANDAMLICHHGLCMSCATKIIHKSCPICRLEITANNSYLSSRELTMDINFYPLDDNNVTRETITQRNISATTQRNRQGTRLGYRTDTNDIKAEFMVVTTIITILWFGLC